MLGVMDAQYDPDLGEIWADCDNTRGNATALLKLGTDGHFTVDSLLVVVQIESRTAGRNAQPTGRD